MLSKRKLIFYFFMGAFAFLSSCDKADTDSCGNGTCESDETATSCAADCSAEAGSCGNGTCESDETATSCAADCNNYEWGNCGDGTCELSEIRHCNVDCNTLCTGESDTAFIEGLSGDGVWSDSECPGLARNPPCLNGGTSGYMGVLCMDGTDEATCEAITLGDSSCVWGGETSGCLAPEVATCAAEADGGQAGCEAAGCTYTDGAAMPCQPAQSENNCINASALLNMTQDVECAWNATTNQCWRPKTGQDEAHAAASGCWTSCTADADAVTCTVECMNGEDHLGSALSSECLFCYVAVQECVQEGCLTECLAMTSACQAECSDDCNTKVAACDACRRSKGCTRLAEICTSGDND